MLFLHGFDLKFLIRGQNSNITISGCYVDIYRDGLWSGAVDKYTKDTQVLKRDNDASSFKLAAGCCVKLFEDGSYKGKHATYCKSVRRLGPENWNDKVSSLKVFPGE